MFFLVAITATLAYAIQGTLMASVYRRFDKLSAVAYRGVSLGVTMSPLLLFAPREEFSKIPGILPLLLVASIGAAIANFCAAKSYSHLPIGVSSAVSMSFASIFATAIGIIFVGEKLTAQQCLFCASSSDPHILWSVSSRAVSILSLSDICGSLLSALSQH